MTSDPQARPRALSQMAEGLGEEEKNAIIMTLMTEQAGIAMGVIDEKQKNEKKVIF